MSDQIPPPTYNSEWHLQPQASYPSQPGSYDGPQQLSGYPSQEGRPQQPVPYQQAHPAYPPQQGYPAYPPQQGYPAYPPQQPGPQYQMPANPYPQPVNISINNVQNGYAYPQPVYDPYSGQARTALTMGIIAVLIWIIPFVGTLTSLICAIIGFINGIQGRKSITRSGSATTGLVLSIVALVFIIGMVLLFGASMLTILAAGKMH